MNIFDTHSHIFSEEYDKDIQEVISRGLEVGVKKILLCGIDKTSIPRIEKMIDTYNNICYGALGFHPTSITPEVFQKTSDIYDYTDKFLKRDNHNNRKYIAIGETGIDLYWDTKYTKEQIESFIIHIELASKYDLPLIIHTRNSFLETIKVISENKKSNTRGIFHCFSGSQEEAEIIINNNFYLGIGGVVTFKNSRLQDVLKNISYDNIVLETDSPYLTPHPHRGKRNENIYLQFIVEKISDIYKIDKEILSDKIYQNSLKLFNITD